jgi:hypothetical protein
LVVKRRNKRRTRKGNKLLSKQNPACSKQVVKSMIESALSKEKQVKFTSTEYSTTISDTVSILVPVSWPAQGVSAYSSDEGNATQGQRIGNKVEFQWLDFNLSWTIEDGAFSSYARFILFQWNPPVESSGEVPGVGDILQTAGSTLPWLCPLNYENRSKYHILDDFTVAMTYYGSNAVFVRRKRYEAMPVKTLKFIGDTEYGTSAGLIKGNLFILAVSDQSSITGHPPALDFSSAFYYTD